MVRTVFGPNSYSVTVKSNLENGTDTILASRTGMVGSEAFDYYAESQGYFRFAIQAMVGVRTIEIEVTFADIAGTSRFVEACEISRD